MTPDQEQKVSNQQPSSTRYSSRGTYGNAAPGSDGYGYGYGYGGYGQKSSQPLLNRSLQDYIHWYLRHFWVLILTGLLGFFYGYYDFAITPPVYQSWAVIEVQRVEREAADIDEDEKVSLGGSGILATIVQKLQMPSVFEAVSRSNLFTNRSDVVRSGKVRKAPWEVFGKPEDKNPTTAVPSPGSLAGMMRGWFSVSVRNSTKLIDLHATHTNPEVARDVLQGVLSEFERVSQENVGESESYTFEYILEQSDEISNKILTVQNSLNYYNKCLEISNRISEAEDQLVKLEMRYLEKWPAVIEAKELIKILQSQFSEELEEVLSRSEEERKFWEEHFELIGNSGDAKSVDEQRKVVQGRASLLGKEIRSEEAILGSLTSKLKEGAISRGFLAKQFNVVQPPTLPGGPIAPNKNAILKKFTIIGIGCGVFLVFVLGLIDPSIRNVADLEALTAIPVIGAIPLARGDKKPDKKTKTERELVLLDNPNSQQAEAIRTLRAGLTYLGDQEERRTFLVTSSLASEGKSWVSANLALAFAQQGDRTLIIDSDLRRPVLHTVFNTEAKDIGLSDFLSGKASIKEVIRKTDVEDLYFMPAGARSPNPAELLASKNLAALCPLLEKHFDRVIFDSAPLVLVSDSLSIAKHVQSVMIVYCVGKTPRRALFRALKYLDANHTSSSGLIANQLPAAKTRRAYGYYYSFSGGGGYDGEYGGYGPVKEETTSEGAAVRKKSGESETEVPQANTSGQKV